jgi:D-alanyl-D-alanine carboxypeptidase
MKGLSEKKKIEVMTTKEDLQFLTSFGEIDLLAEAVYVYDIKNDTALFAKNENTPLPLASLTKVVTALVALETVPEKAIVPITAQALNEEGDTGLRIGERWRVSDLTRFMLVNSSNDAAEAIALAVSKIISPEATTIDPFIVLMNQKSADLRLTSATFSNATGLDAPDLLSTGGTASAKDITVLLVALLKQFPDVFTATSINKISVRSLDGFLHTAKNTNMNANSTQLLYASKTGFTDLAGGNLSIVFQAGPGRPVAITVLGSTENGRFTDVAALLAATMRYITAQ